MGLSVAANAFSIVGLAGVIYCSAVKVSNLVSCVRGASYMRSRLLAPAQSVIVVVVEARKLAYTHPASEHTTKYYRIVAEALSHLSNCINELQKRVSYPTASILLSRDSVPRRWPKHLCFGLNICN